MFTRTWMVIEVSIARMRTAPARIKMSISSLVWKKSDEWLCRVRIFLDLLPFISYCAIIYEHLQSSRSSRTFESLFFWRPSALFILLEFVLLLRGLWMRLWRGPQTRPRSISENRWLVDMQRNKFSSPTTISLQIVWKVWRPGDSQTCNETSSNSNKQTSRFESMWLADMQRNILGFEAIPIRTSRRQI